MDYRVVKVPVIDTGLGQEAGYANDAEMLDAAEAHLAELKALLAPEALAKLDIAEAEGVQRFLFGE